MGVNFFVERSRILKVLLIALLFIVVNTDGYASFDISAERYLLEEGLPSNSITAIIQDENGFIWIGTSDGLSKFDGLTFTNYRNTPFDSSTISGNHITSLAEDKAGNIWVGTLENGYFKVSSNGMINRFGEEEKFITNNFSASYVGTVHQGTYVILSHSRGFKILKSSNSSDGAFEVVARYTFDNEVVGVISVSELGDGILIAAEDIFINYNIEANSFTKLNVTLPEGVHLKRLKSIDNSHIVAGTSSELLLMKKVGKDMLVVSRQPNLNVNTILLSNENELIVGSSSGIFVVDKADGLAIRQELSETLGLIDVRVVLQDSQGLLWVGTKQEGLYKLDLSSSPIRYKSFLEMKENGTMGYTFLSVASLIQLSDGKILLGGESGNLILTDENEGSKTSFFIKNSSELTDYNIKALYELPNKDLFIGTDKGLFRFNNQTKLVERVKIRENSPLNIQVNSFFKEDASKLWIATNIGLFAFENEQFSPLDSTKIRIRSVTKSKDGVIWIGAKDGLYVINTGETLIKKVLSDVASSTKLLSLPINSLVVDQKNNVWIGTESGLYVYSNGKAEPYYQGDKVMTELAIPSLLIDDKERVWGTSPKGIFCITESGTDYYFGKGSGLGNFLPRSALLTKNDQFYIGSEAGVAIIDVSKKSSTHTIDAKIAISKVRVSVDETQAFLEVGSKRSLKLRGASDLVVSFHLALSDFRNPSRNSFKYRIKGEAKPWKYLGHDNIATFYNLPVGDNVIEFQASNSNGQWAQEPLVFTLTIDPPLFKSGYAIVFYVLALFFIIQLIYNFGFRYLRNTKKSLAEEKVLKKLFESQSIKLSLTNKSLTDSIDYAKRIQVALLPTVFKIRSILPRAFVYFKPKDIVSGDFYAVFEKNNKIIIAAADCTGHGVPGAFMSMIGFDMLKNIVTVQSVNDPAEILKIMNNEVVSMLRHGANDIEQSDSDVYDGMDMAICVVDTKEQNLSFAGAVNPLYLIRNNEIITYKGSRYSVGHNWIGDKNVFETTIVPIEKDDACFMFTDGYVDQFGGSEGKKFKFRRFRHLLLQIHRLPYSQQQAAVKNMMKEWMDRGDHAQVDDMLIFGFSPLATEE